MSDLIINPKGNPGPKPIDHTTTSRAQTRGVPYDEVGTVPGGEIPVVVPPANRAGGVGSAGNSSKPFKLGA